MQWDRRNDALRIALDFPTGTLVGEHTARVEAIRSEYAHTILLKQESTDLTCVPYAVELASSPVYRAIAADFDREVFAGSNFVEWLLNNRLCEVSHPSAGVLALYFSDGIWRHAGFVTDANRIKSKWGTFPLYDHDFWEVPISYGDELRFFKRPSPEGALVLFLDYCRFERISDRNIADILAEVDKSQ
jgi:hypothetical protein